LGKLFETNLPLPTFPICFAECLQCADDGVDDLLVLIYPGMRFIQARFDVGQAELKSAQRDECPDDQDAHFDGKFAVQDIRRLDDAMFGEGPGQVAVTAASV
jgi:hypothetical protein